MNVSEDFQANEGRFDVDLLIEHVFFAGGCAKKMTLPKGYRIGTHKHAGAHQSFYFGGPVLLRTDHYEKTLPAPYGAVAVEGSTNHEIEALGDTIWICMLETDETDPAKVDATVIEKV